MRPVMLSDADQRRLSEIETRLRQDDPAFVDGLVRRDDETR